jgi:hypothetical protein
MGELDAKVFANCRQDLSQEDAHISAVSLCSSWQAEITNPMWYPFKVVKVDGEPMVMRISLTIPLTYIYIF